jgi:soluble lytic murein transglycosylase-like protein
MKKVMKRGTQRLSLQRARMRARKRRGRAIAAGSGLMAIPLIMLALQSLPNEKSIEASPVVEKTVEDYQMEETAREQKEEAEAEAEELKASIEAYQAEQERLAEEEYKEPEELPYPFNTAPDICEADLEGFEYYEIPEEYSDYGGYLPRAMQEYLYSICQDAGYDYPTALAQIEKESAYQYDRIGAAGDTGYFQVIPKYHVERMEKLYATDMLNPYQNALVAIDYMAELLEKYDGNVSKALTAYNCGPSGAYKYYFSAGVDANGYAKAVLKKAERIRKQLKKNDEGGEAGSTDK